MALTFMKFLQQSFSKVTSFSASLSGLHCSYSAQPWLSSTLSEGISIHLYDALWSLTFFNAKKTPLHSNTIISHVYFCPVQQPVKTGTCHAGPCRGEQQTGTPHSELTQTEARKEVGGYISSTNSGQKNGFESRWIQWERQS